MTGVQTCALPILYLEKSILDELLKNSLYYVWIFTITLFILLTMRSMNYMITIFFAKDNIDVCIIDEEPKNLYSEDERKKVKEKYRR